ncbi:MAG: hypothetical protein HY455_03405 [Parcubacteria group bacterium]|nr:hypothetical protein [Parcubacteria group bacterium]
MDQELLGRMVTEASAKYGRLRPRLGHKTALKDAIRFTLNESGVQGSRRKSYWGAMSRKLGARGGQVTAAKHTKGK